MVSEPASPVGAEPADAIGSRPVPIETGADPNGVWRSLLDTWMTFRAVSQERTHVKAGYRWTASAYAPALVRSGSGRPVLTFEK